MVDVHTALQRSYNMSKIRGLKTKPELKALAILRNKGFLFQPDIYGKPDFVNFKDKVVAFIDGCFWHRCPVCYIAPSTNKDFWNKKIKGNVLRDIEVTKNYQSSGWKVVRIWEHDMRKQEIYKSKLTTDCMKKELKVIDLFCGAGGLSTGFQKAGYNILVGIDHDKKALETFQANHPNSKIICGDMTKIKSEDIFKNLESSDVDVIIGGPPCQGFSMAGKRRPNDPRNSLFKEYLRLVKEIKPKAFVMENVKGLLSMKNENGKDVIEIILGEFRKIDGYNVEVFKVNSANFGVPQRRQRIFIIGTKKNISFSFPIPTHDKNPENNALKKWVGIKNVLTNSEDVPKKFFYSKKLINGFKRRERQNAKKGLGFGWQFNNFDKPSYTISARYWKDGAESLIKYSEDSIRMLTPWECALVQSFPKDYIFKGSERDIYVQIGNAVPPLVAEKIAEALKIAIL